ncbi:hypothetical protein VOLCADRAFT_99428 [Volvox carteri f. nagariensis]|uniref:Uncharacterized protein n=1 Tax=Volvox carteri f. nagariensis TaxID=3068 RepID=D8UHS5_VOLCA|nr:uncharacterized protein VOLCADRAFT_99428 [Volvox carteri f. nagariensis]EFJ40735.1 hypothetical protein VOLCADRAFT_99428 [Volvox carteri f. nagariensis]|eukprot:XP_002958201.1 hypothetical protein VOLCADRAFT_99428 [Volvox carteri f. nagariensis]
MNFTTDPNVIVIWSYPYAYCTGGTCPPDYECKYFYKSYYTPDPVTNATFHLRADDNGTLFVNNLLKAPSFGALTFISVDLLAGQNILALEACNNGGPSWVSGTLFAPNNTVLLQVRWISSLPTAFVPFGQRVIASAWQSTTFYRTFWLSAEQLQQQQAALGGVVTTPVLNLTIIADDLATAFVNGQEVGRTAVFPERSVLQVSNLRPGPNLVVLHCNSTGGPAVVAASLAFGGPDGSVLLQTDHTWNWL